MHKFPSIEQVRTMSTEELGQEYAAILIVQETGATKFFSSPDGDLLHTEILGDMLNVLEAAYRSQPDAESLDAFVESAFENQEDAKVAYFAEQRRQRDRETLEAAGTGAVGKRVFVDGWGEWTTILSEDAWVESDWRLATGQPVIESLATKFRRTGRTIQRKDGVDVVRVEITFVGDCEDDTVARGWMEA